MIHKGKLVKLFVSCIITQSQIYNEWLASGSSCFTTRKGDTSTHSQGGWVSPTTPDWTTITINLSVYANIFHISWNTCSSCPLTLHTCSHTSCLTFSRTMKKVSILYFFRISLCVFPSPGMYKYLSPSRRSVSLVTWTFLKDEKLPFYPIR